MQRPTENARWLQFKVDYWEDDYVDEGGKVGPFAHPKTIDEDDDESPTPLQLSLPILVLLSLTLRAEAGLTYLAVVVMVVRSSRTYIVC